VNRHPTQPLTCAVKFKDKPLNGTFSTVMLQGDSPEAFNDVEQPERVVPERKRITFKEGAVELPPHSLTIFRVPSPAAK
jgi:alpha-L-arabinofuranosidase